MNEPHMERDGKTDHPPMNNRDTAVTILVREIPMKQHRTRTRIWALEITAKAKVKKGRR